MSDPLADLLRLERGRARAEVFSTFENLISSPEGFALKTIAPLQRAVCRAYDGIDIGDELWSRIEVQQAFVHRPKPVRPKEFLLLSGIRSF